MNKELKFTKGEKLQREGEDGVWRDVTVTEYHPSVGYVSFFYDDNPKNHFVGGQNWFRPRPAGWDYPNGPEQYAADLEILKKTSALAKDATEGGWEWLDSLISPFYRGLYSQGWVIESTYNGEIIINNPADAELILNVARVATALSRMLPYLQGKGGL